MDDDANLPRDAPIAYADPLAHGEPDEAPHGEAEEGEAEPENAPAVAVDPVTAAEERARADQARLELRVEEIRAGVRTPNEEILLRCLNAVEVENARLERLVDQTLAPDENRGGSPGPGWLAEDAAVDRPWDDTSEAQKKRDEWKSNDSDMRGRTRQADSTFYDKPESQCLVSFKTQHTLLKSALELNQKLFWKVLECHAPQQQREEYLEGWRLVRFGKDDLSEAFPQGIERALGHVFPALSVDACGGMTGLRNAVHHPKSFPSDKVEELLRKAQGFAIELTNEKYAMRIRRWRDQFQEEVEKAHAELAQWVVEPSETIKNAVKIFQGRRYKPGDMNSIDPEVPNAHESESAPGSPESLWQERGSEIRGESESPPPAGVVRRRAMTVGQFDFVEGLKRKWTGFVKKSRFNRL